MNREELIALANEIEYCIKNHVQPFLTERGWTNVAAALRAKADSVSAPMQDGIEWLLNNKTNRAFDAALKKYPDAFEALHFFWNEGIAGATPSPERTSDGVRELTRLAAECHRAKWQFDLSEDYQPSKSAARALILKGFDELHRIGDMALKLRATLSSTPTDVLPIVTRTHDVS